MQLKVYYVFGNEVATLVHEYRKAGKYIAEFNSKELSSEIYAYKIQVVNFVETKYVLLIK